MMPTEVIFEVGVCTTGSSPSAPWSQGGSFYQETPETARGVDKRRSTPATPHQLKYLFQGDQTSRSWDLFPLHLPSLYACLDDVQHSCCTYAWKICCSGEMLESLHMHERNLLLATLCPVPPGKHRTYSTYAVHSIYACKPGTSRTKACLLHLIYCGDLYTNWAYNQKCWIHYICLISPLPRR